MESRTQILLKKYLKLWRTLSGWKLFLWYTLHYTLLFAVLWQLMFAVFQGEGKSLLWVQDGLPVYFSRMVYLSQTIREGIQSFLNGNGWTVPLYDFRIGPAKMDLQVEPLQWLAALCPWDKIDVFYTVTLILRYYLIGLSFSAFGFFFRQKPLPVLIGAISYTFCGYTFFAGRHPFFLASLIYLPLLLIGTEKILRQEKPFLFIAMVFLSVVSYVYFGCMLAILVLLYFLIRIATDAPRKGRSIRSVFAQFIISGGIGIALGGIVLMPMLVQLLGNGRVGRDIFAYTNMLVYPGSYYQRFLTNFLLVPGGIGHWTHLAFSVFTVPAILALFIRRDRNEKTLRCVFLVLTGMMLIPSVAYVLSGFNTISNRWGFAYAFCCAAVVMFELPHILTMDKRQLAMLTLGSVLYVAVCYFLIPPRYYEEAPVVLLLVTVGVLWLCSAVSWKGTGMKGLLCLGFTCLSVYYSAYLMFAPEQLNTVSQYADQDTAYAYFDQSQYSSLAKSNVTKRDTSFYRVSGDSISREAVNASFYYGLNGLSGYPLSSCYYASYLDWLKEMESTRDRLNLEYGPVSRAPMLTLASVKYYVSRETGKEVLPFGFYEVDSVQGEDYKDTILENAYALPIGYTYDSYMTYADYEALSAVQKQEAQVQAVVLKERPGSEKIPEQEISTSATQLSPTVTDMQDMNWQNGKVNVQKAGATMTLAFFGLPRTETYLRVVNLDLTNQGRTDNWILSVQTEKSSAKTRFCADGYLYSPGAKTQLLDLGYSEEGYTSCTITFPEAGTFLLEDLQIWCQPMEQYIQDVRALSEETLENMTMHNRGFQGDITVSEDKILCLAIPFDEGWKAYLDGKRVDILQANTAFMAIELEAGRHRVEFRYWMPGLTEGIFLSIGGFFGLLVMLAYWKRKGKSRKEG